MKLTREEHSDFIRASIQQGKSYREIGRAIGCDHMTVQKFVRLNMPDVVRVKAVFVQAVEAEEPSELELLKQQHRDLKSSARKHRTVDVQAEMLLQEIRAHVTPAEPVYEPPDDAEGDGHSHVQALMLSDLHVGEVVAPEAVNGLNEFNWDILRERMASIQKSLYSFQNARPYPIDELHIWMLGDMCGGRNHEELAETNEFSVADQCYMTGMLLGEWIEPLVEHYPTIKVFGVAGNHPRVSKATANKRVFDNFDWLAYKYAETYLGKYETVSCEFPRSGYIVDRIADQNVLLFHGDGIRSSMPGVPWGGVMRRFNELKKSYAAQGILLDHAALGHFHQAAVVSGIFMNGSVKGLDEYSLKQFGAGEKPTQLLLTFDRTRARLTDCSYITP